MHSSVYTEPSPLSPLHSKVFGAESYSAHDQRRNVNNNPATNPVMYSGVLPARYARAMVTQSCGSNQQYRVELRPIPGDGTHTQHCLDGQEQETG